MIFEIEDTFKKPADIYSEPFFQSHQPFCKVFGAIICCLILIQVLVQRLHAHVTAVCYQFRDGLVGVEL